MSFQSILPVPEYSSSKTALFKDNPIIFLASSLKTPISKDEFSYSIHTRPQNLHSMDELSSKVVIGKNFAIEVEVVKLNRIDYGNKIFQVPSLRQCSHEGCGFQGSGGVLRGKDGGAGSEYGGCE